MSEVWCANSAVSVAFQFSDVYGNAIGVCRDAVWLMMGENRSSLKWVWYLISSGQLLLRRVGSEIVSEVYGYIEWLY